MQTSDPYINLQILYETDSITWYKAICFQVQSIYVKLAKRCEVREIESYAKRFYAEEKLKRFSFELKCGRFGPRKRYDMIRSFSYGFW